ncbi:oligosaccharide repeat unit polymerase [Gammaproteobacteria bacterium]|nr:oligosaccharide repeat unit polymerase [Gammaproteobacteria bacterium]
MNNFDETYYIDFGVTQFVSIFLSLSIIIISLFCFFTDRSYRSRFVWFVNFFWSTLLLLNRSRLSGLQIEWTYVEQILINFVIFVPSITILFLISIFPKKNINAIQDTFNFFDLTRLDGLNTFKVVKVFTFLIATIFLIDMVLYGIPLFTINLGSAILNDTRTSARLPILFTFAHSWVLITVIACSMLVFSNRIAKKWLSMIIILYTFHSILMFGRGSVIYMFAAILLCFFIFSKRTNLSKIMIVILPISLILILFSLAGTLRQSLGEGDNLIPFSVVEYGLFKPYTPEFISWLYGYAVINFDNLILCIRDFESRGEVGFKTLLNFAPSFIGELLNLEYSSRAVDGLQSLPYVGRFNLTTAYGSIGYDYGWMGVFGYSFFIFSLLPIAFYKNFKNLGTSSKIFLVYLLLSFLFITISNLILTSRILGFISGILLFKFFSSVFKLKSSN